MICNCWHEIDTNNGTLIEYCQLTGKPCGCGGDKPHCEYKST